ncbi:MAG: SDR family oxidoreductase [Anaerolineales bacterium]|nr:SDR family oxidoreductase [Anaerolineales bacterium]
MKIDFDGKVVMVTGAAGALGSVVARTFYGAGAKLVCVDLDRDGLERIFEGVSTSPGDYVNESIDLTNPDEVKAAVERTIKHSKRIDVLVNTVGGFRSGTPVHETSMKEWDFLMNLNARSVLVAVRAVIPNMLAQKDGAIVNVGARPGLEGQARMVAYSASKSAVIRLTESVSAEVKDFGIRVNCILPGTIDTAQNRKDMPKADFSTWVKPESLANVILFLSSEQARDIHGAALPVYGRS